MNPSKMKAHLRMMCRTTMESSMSDTDGYEKASQVLDELGEESTKDKRIRLNLYLPSEAYMPQQDPGWGRVHCEVMKMAHNLEFVEVSPKEGSRSGETFNVCIYDLTFDSRGNEPLDALL